MEFKKEKLETIKNALQYATLYAKTEKEEADFGFLLVEVQTKIIEEAEQEKRIKELKSLDGCVFKYCPYNPKCESKCTHKSS